MAYLCGRAAGDESNLSGATERRGASHDGGGCVRPWSARPADLCSRGTDRSTAGGNRSGCVRWRSPVRWHLLRRGLLLRADLRAATCASPGVHIRHRTCLSVGRETGVHDPQRTAVSPRHRSGVSVSLGQRMQVGQQVCLQAGIQAGRGGPRKCGRRRPAGRRCESEKGASAPSYRSPSLPPLSAGSPAAAAETEHVVRQAQPALPTL
jgi:hypothetical protein